MTRTGIATMKPRTSHATRTQTPKMPNSAISSTSKARPIRRRQVDGFATVPVESVVVMSASSCCATWLEDAYEIRRFHDAGGPLSHCLLRPYTSSSWACRQDTAGTHRLGLGWACGRPLAAPLAAPNQRSEEEQC